MRMNRLVLIVLLVLLVVLFLMGLGQPLVLAFFLFVGWARYLIRVVPEVRVPPESAAVAGACLLMIILLGHVSGRWLWNAMKPEAAPRWKMQFTATGVLLLVLLFACGMAATGAAHQVGWLLTDPKPMWQFGSGRLGEYRCMDNAEQIGWALDRYAEDHEGRLPDHLENLRAIDPEIDLVCPSNLRHAYIYYGSGLSLPLDENVILLAEPLANHDGKGMTILRHDLYSDFVDADEAAALLSRQ